VPTVRPKLERGSVVLAVDLSALRIATATPLVVEFGGVLTPALGGPIQRIDRVGSRWAFAFETPVMDVEPDGRRWAARLARAKREGALIAIPQPDLDIGNPGAPTVATNIASGKLVPLAGLIPGYRVQEGQWVSLIVGGHRYADQVTGDAVAGADGSATIRIQNLLRAPLVGGEVVEIAEPKVEGSLEGQFSWSLDNRRETSFGFTVTEDA